MIENAGSTTAAPAVRRVDAAPGGRGGLVGFVRRHPLVSLLLVFNTFGQAAALVPVVVYRVYGVQLDVDWVLSIACVLFLLLPALAITRIAHGRAGLRALVRSAFRFRVRARWYVLALVVLPALTVVLQGSAPPGGWSAAAVGDAYGRGFLVALAFNFLTTNWWEETVWTGFFQGRLQERFGPWRAVVITWPFFFLQHVTLVLPGSSLGGGWASLLALAVVIPFFRMAVAYVYNRTHSLAIVGLVHAASNAVGAGLMARLYGVGGSGLLVFALFGLLVLVATRGRLGLPAPALRASPRPCPPTSPLPDQELR